MKSRFFTAVMLGTMLPMMFSCGEKQEEQVLGPAALAIQGAGGEMLKYTVDDRLTSVTIDLRVEAEEITGSVLSVGLMVDLSLVDSYNDANSSDYLPLPADAFEMSASSVILPQYNTVSSTVQLTVDGNQIAENGTYLLPVTFDKVEGEENTEFVDGKDVLYILIERNFPEDAKIRTYTLSQIPDFAASVHAFCWLPDGKMAISGNNDTNFGGGVVSVDPASGASSTVINNFPTGWCAYGVEVAGNVLYAGYKNGMVGAFDLSSSASGDPVVVISNLNNVLDLAVDDEDNLFVLCRGDLWNNHGRIYKYSAEEMTSAIESNTPFGNVDEHIFKEFDSRILCMDFDVAGDLVVWTANGFYKLAKDVQSEPQYLFGKIGTSDVDGIASDAAFVDLYCFSIDTEGNMWAADFGAKKIKFVQKGEADDYSDAVVSTVFGGNSSLGSLGDNSPRGLLASEDGMAVWFNDNTAKKLYKITVTLE